MLERLIISGFGGQGVMLLGKLLATCAMYEGRFVTFMPAYGAEVRGGTAHCSVIISDEEIASPCIEEIDTLIALNKPSFIKFLPMVSKYGEVFANSSMIEKIKEKHNVKKIHFIPFSELALKLEDAKAANLIALGAYLKNKKIVSLGTVNKILEESFNNEELLRINKGALKEGLKW